MFHGGSMQHHPQEQFLVQVQELLYFINTIEYVTIATLGDAQDFGDLTVIRG